MREIKFRAWDNERNHMNYKVCVGNTDEDDENHTCSTILIDGKWVHFDKYNDIIVEQYTGLKDKNGVEIYEGDILKISDGVHITFEEVYFGVDRGENYPAYTITNLEWKFSANPFSELLDSTTDYEFVVVGNIHENPEIMGGKRK